MATQEGEEIKRDDLNNRASGLKVETGPPAGSGECNVSLSAPFNFNFIFVFIVE